MANPKYANLPGIAPPDEKDVYETDDLPEADQDLDFIEEGENESIERPHLSISDAHSKFRDKTLLGGRDTDFSDRLRRKRHTGYYAISGDWEIAGEDEKESVVQKYHRLQCEMKELIEEINELKKNSADTKNENHVSSVSLIPKLEDSLSQLNNFNLNEILGGDYIATLSDPQGTQIKKLLTQIESLKTNGGEKGKPKSGIGEGEGKGGLLTYQLLSLPEQTKLQQTTRVNDLEQRLRRLEAVLGTSTDNVNRLKSRDYSSVTEAVDDLGAKVSLLDPNQIDRVESKLSALANRLDTVAEKRRTNVNEKDVKVNELYELLKKTESLSATLPAILDKLIALKAFQTTAADFSKSLSEYQARSTSIDAELEDNQQVLKQMQSDLRTHGESIATMVKGLETRLQAIKK